MPADQAELHRRAVEEFGARVKAVGDDQWEHLTNGLPGEADVHAITVHPDNPDVVYVGSTKGAYRSSNRGDSWERLHLPDGDADIWSICLHPENPRIVYAGASPPGVYRSEDGGDNDRNEQRHPQS